ncbi:exported hypothetical protein [Azospirillaceae bacterium]
MKFVRCLAGAFLLGLTALPAMADSQPVVVGAIEILTGPSSRYGVAIKAGLDLALDEINAAGGVQASTFFGCRRLRRKQRAKP